MESNESSSVQSASAGSPVASEPLDPMVETLLKGLKDPQSPLRQALLHIVADAVTDEVSEQMDDLDIEDLTEQVSDAIDVDSKIEDYVNDEIDWNARVTEELDYDEIARNLDYEDIASETACHIDTDEIADTVRDNLDIDEQIEDAVNNNLDFDAIAEQVVSDHIDIEDSIRTMLDEGNWFILSKDQPEYQVALDRLKEVGMAEASRLFANALFQALKAEPEAADTVSNEA